jgi:hypothetical protein
MTPVNQSKPKRLAITIAGAVSLGSYEAGVLYEVLEAIRQHNADERTKANPENRIIVDVLTGASAGGMTSIILAQKLLYEGPTFKGPCDNPLYNIWIAGIDIEALQATKAHEPALISLFSSDLIERISNETLLGRYSSGFPPSPPAIPHPSVDEGKPLRVGVALSNLNGVDYGYQVQPQGVFEYRAYADQMTREINPLDATCDTRLFWTPLHEAAVACGAFPFAFRPKEVDRNAGSEPNDYPSETLTRWPTDTRRFTYTDGGVLQNQPLGLAKKLVDLQDEHFAQECRYYLFVSPYAKDDGPPNDFKTKDAHYIRMMARLATVVIGQAGFRDWITAEDINDRIRLMDERADGLVRGILEGTVAVEPLQATARSILDLLFPPGVALLSPGANVPEMREVAQERIADQYHSEMEYLKDLPGAGDAFRDSMLAFEAAAGLGARDKMRIYGITATTSELAGAGLQAFLGFFDRTFREHDYDVGRKKAREVLLSSALNGKGELGPIYFDPSLNPLRPINDELSGIAYKQVSPQIRRCFKKALQRRVGQMVMEWGRGNILFLPIKWIIVLGVGCFLDWVN